MTIEQDALRADLRASMTASMPDYSVDSEAGGRVGKAIGRTAGHEERKVRASDSRGHSTDKVPDESRNGDPNHWLWIVSCGLSLGMVVLLGMLAYWRFA
jgi:hypothetical protein